MDTMAGASRPGDGHLEDEDGVGGRGRRADRAKQRVEKTGVRAFTVGLRGLDPSRPSWWIDGEDPVKKHVAKLLSVLRITSLLCSETIPGHIPWLRNHK